jgi:hypothetical protein
MSTYLRRPAGVLSALRKRWPDAITATVEMKAPLNNVPRLPIQVGASLRRVVLAMKRKT